jgi:hypothetical protein
MIIYLFIYLFLFTSIIIIISALELVSSRNIEELVLVLRKEVAKTHNVVEHEDTGKYRQLLVRTLHSCCIKVTSKFSNIGILTYNYIQFLAK